MRRITTCAFAIGTARRAVPAVLARPVFGAHHSGQVRWCATPAEPTTEVNGPAVAMTAYTHHLPTVLQRVATHYGLTLPLWTFDDLRDAGEKGLRLCRFDDADTRLVYERSVGMCSIVRRSHRLHLADNLPPEGYTEPFLRLFVPYFSAMTRTKRNQTLHGLLLGVADRTAIENVTFGDDRHLELWPGEYVDTQREAEAVDMRDVCIVVGPSGSGKTAFAQHSLWRKVSSAAGVSVMIASANHHAPKQLRGELLKVLSQKLAKDAGIEMRDITATSDEPIVDHLFVVLDEFSMLPAIGNETVTDQLVKLRVALVEAMPCCKRVTLCVVGTGLMHEAAAIQSNTPAQGIVKYRLTPWSAPDAWKLIDRAIDHQMVERGSAMTPPTRRWNLRVGRYAKAIAALALGLRNSALDHDVAAGSRRCERHSSAVALLTRLWATPRAALVCVPLLLRTASSRWDADATVPFPVGKQPSTWDEHEWRYMLKGVDGQQELHRGFLAATEALIHHATPWIEHALMVCFALNGLSAAGEEEKRRVARAILQLASSGFMHPSGTLRRCIAPAEEDALKSVVFLREKYDANTWLALCKDLECLRADGPLRAVPKHRRVTADASCQQKRVVKLWGKSALRLSAEDQCMVLRIWQWTVTSSTETTGGPTTEPAAEPAEIPNDVVDVDAVARAVRYGMLVQRDTKKTEAESDTKPNSKPDTDTQRPPEYSVPLVGLLTALLIARIALPRAAAPAERLEEVSLAMVAATHFVARSTDRLAPEVPRFVATEPNVFDPTPFTMSLNARHAPGPDGFCDAVAVQAKSSVFADGVTKADAPFDFYAECGKARVLKPLHVAEAVVQCKKAARRRAYCRHFLGCVLPGGALAKLANVAAPPKPSALVVVTTHQRTAAEDLVKNRARCDREVFFIGPAQLGAWDAVIGFSKLIAEEESAEKPTSAGQEEKRE